MSPDLLAIKLKAYARELGFDDAGLALVDDHVPFTAEVKAAYEDGRFGPLDYLDKTLAIRLDIRRQFPLAKTVLVVVKNYYRGDHKDYDDNYQQMPKIARYAWGKDYHQWFKKRLKKFKPFIEALLGHEVNVMPFNDTAPMLERAWALKAGLGFIGKSSMFIHRHYGTWTLLGGIVLDLALPPDNKYQGPDCGSCTRCLDACPTKAIIKPRMVDANKCISTWTIERPLHRDAFEKAPRDHGWAFGCDICQEVCPWNKFQTLTAEERFNPIPGRVFLSQETLVQDLRGSPLFRSRKPGLLANFLRIQNSLKNTNVKELLGQR